MWKEKLQIKILMSATKVLQNTKKSLGILRNSYKKILKLTFVHNCYVEHYAKQNSSSHFYFVLQWERLQWLEVYFTRLECTMLFLYFAH